MRADPTEMPPRRLLQELAAFPGGGGKEGAAPVPWDPLQLSELWKVGGRERELLPGTRFAPPGPDPRPPRPLPRQVSANNPDVAWLREDELKHGRMSML